MNAQASPAIALSAADEEIGARLLSCSRWPALALVGDASDLRGEVALIRCFGSGYGDTGGQSELLEVGVGSLSLPISMVPGSARVEVSIQAIQRWGVTIRAGMASATIEIGEVVGFDLLGRVAIRTKLRAADSLARWIDRQGGPVRRSSGLDGFEIPSPYAVL